MLLKNACPCCSNKSYANCCQRFISKQLNPDTPEELMRSRYTAYTQANIEYIMDTMKPPASNHFDAEDARKWAQTVKWRKLEVLKTSQDQDKGFVEFIAYFSHQQQQQKIHEYSEFHRENGRWYYVDGTNPT